MRRINGAKEGESQSGQMEVKRRVRKKKRMGRSTLWKVPRKARIEKITRPLYANRTARDGMNSQARRTQRRTRGIIVLEPNSERELWRGDQKSRREKCATARKNRPRGKPRNGEEGDTLCPAERRWFASDDVEPINCGRNYNGLTGAKPCG